MIQSTIYNIYIFTALIYNRNRYKVHFICTMRENLEESKCKQCFLLPFGFNCHCSWQKWAKWAKGISYWELRPVETHLDSFVLGLIYGEPPGQLGPQWASVGNLPSTLSVALALRGWCWFWWSGDTWHSNSLNLPSCTSSTYRWYSPAVMGISKYCEYDVHRC